MRVRKIAAGVVVLALKELPHIMKKDTIRNEETKECSGIDNIGEKMNHIEQERIRKARRKRKRKRRRQITYIIKVSSIFLVTVVFFLFVKVQIGKVIAALNQTDTVENQEGILILDREPLQEDIEEVSVDYVNFVGMMNVGKPVQRDYFEIIEQLEELGKKNEIIERISGNTEVYPEEILEALANNPEMADFVEGYPDADGSVTGGLTELEKIQEYPLFLQWDPRWGYASYGNDSNIGLVGCGPTSLSMVLYYLTKDENITPDKIAQYSMENGYYMSGTGTMWSLMEDVPLLYGIKVNQPGISDQKIKRELDQGNIIICAMRAGDFTTGGHYIVIYGYDEDGLKVNDANCVSRSRKSWAYEEIGSQIKSLWSFSS